MRNTMHIGVADINEMLLSAHSSPVHDVSDV